MGSRGAGLKPALADSVAAGIIFGLGHGLFVIDTMHDYSHSSPAFAALGVLALGALVGIVALPVFAAALSLLMLRGSGRYRLGGSHLLVFVGGVAWVGAVIVITGGS